MGISTFNPDMRVFIAQKPGKWSAISCLFAFSAAFCPLFLSFHLFLCFQLPSNIMVYRFFRRGFILEPPGLKERVPSLRSFFDRTPPFIATLHALGGQPFRIPIEGEIYHLK